MTDNVIDIDALSKAYRTGFRRQAVFAVRKLSLSVKRGSVVAFVGPNGAGKTTTIHALLGFLKPDTGTVRVFGEPLNAASLNRIGYQSEIFYTYSFYTAPQALRYYGRLSGMALADVNAVIPPLLDRLGLSESRNRRATTFSKGMMQRLGLAQALLHQPELLILDEPTSGLDPEGRRLVLDIIREEKTKGRTVFLSSHILADVERICDEVVMVRKGEVVFKDHLVPQAASQRWEIEVLGWSRTVRDSLADIPSVSLSETEDRALLVCTSETKRDVLRKLVLLDLDIGTVQRHRVTNLEEVYMKHVGKA